MGSKPVDITTFDCFNMTHLLKASVFLAFAITLCLTQDQERCSEPKDSGSGQNYTQKFFYDPIWNACLAFKFGGSGGNGNRFDSRDECEGICLPLDGPECTGPGKNSADPIVSEDHKVPNSDMSYLDYSDYSNHHLTARRYLS
ncbi:hypothetical protein L596_012407 [Steinernema carpocapsae]|uniref:BPTI/Kunitz inhibitor domain-containing protein n=1 Tax=Steinernema carpocapsae TaxID=34508 RepID=A0A4U5NWY5_STECR|nr:hypothetical protein L596_012407 [Steinernema carpocapsae]